jgi:hypothetical protein
MKAVSCALLCCGCVGLAQGIEPSPLKSLAEALLAQHPTKGSFGNRISTASQQGKAGKINQARKNPVMNVKETVSETEIKSKFDVKDLAGITAPLGFFDPAGFTEDASEGKIRFYREVELKHGRLGMLAALGFLVAEQFHPLFGGNIDAPAYLAFQQTPLAAFWGVVLGCIGALETFSVFTFNSPFGGEPWSVRSDHTPGNLGFDPLNLKPTDPEEFKEMQTKELNNGRLAMLAAAGMIAQEFVTGQKLFS